MKINCLLTLLAVRKQTISFHQSATDTEKSMIWRCLVAEKRYFLEIEFVKKEETMNLIVAVDKNWAIGKNNELLVRIPADQKFFRETTTGKVVVMGRKTLESFPNGLPLKKRTNIVLTHDKNYKVPDAIIVHTMEELHEELKKYDSEDIYVIGGETIYRQLLDECDVAHVTKIDYAFDADTYFPNLDEMPEWEITADSEEQTYFDLEYYFYKYEKKKAVQ